MTDGLTEEVVGLIPAAGYATRLGNAFAGSKEVLEVGGVPVAGHLLDQLESAGVRRAVVVLREDKTDVPSALEGYNSLEIEYLLVGATPSELHSVAAGLRFLPERTVALGYPDILSEPKSVYRQLIKRMSETGADLVLGLFPSSIAERVDMVAIDHQSRPVEVVIKQPDRGLRYSWAVALWGPAFTENLIELVSEIDSEDQEEPSVGQAVQRAIDTGLSVEAVRFDDGGYVDIGTPASLAEARERFST